MPGSNVCVLLTLLCGVLAWGEPVAAVEHYTEHTYRLGDGEQRPVAEIGDAAWLAGSWTGTAFGERFEETWNPPSGGTMVGTFKLFAGDAPGLYEILLLAVEDQSLVLKVRHFNADFSAWEGKDEHLAFRLVSFTDDELHFSGLSFYRRDENRIDAYLVMRDENGFSEQHLVYERRQAPLASR